MKNFFLIFSLLILTFLAIGASTNEALVSQEPTPDAVIIVSKGRNWTIRELHRIGFEFLRKNGTLPNEAKVRAIVHILPGDKAIMCEILYIQDFGQPYWTVRIGYDGKVASYEKRKKNEG